MTTNTEPKDKKRKAVAKSIRKWPWGTIIIAVGVLAVGGMVGYIVALWQYVGGTPSAAIIGALTGLVGATSGMILGVGGI